MEDEVRLAWPGLPISWSMESAGEDAAYLVDRTHRPGTRRKLVLGALHRNGVGYIECFLQGCHGPSCHGNTQREYGSQPRVVRSYSAARTRPPALYMTMTSDSLTGGRALGGMIS